MTEAAAAAEILHYYRLRAKNGEIEDPVRPDDIVSSFSSSQREVRSFLGLRSVGIRFLVQMWVSGSTVLE